MVKTWAAGILALACCWAETCFSALSATRGGGTGPGRTGPAWHGSGHGTVIDRAAGTYDVLGTDLAELEGDPQPVHQEYGYKGVTRARQRTSLSRPTKADQQRGFASWYLIKLHRLKD
jgi:hypothetical protein